MTALRISAYAASDVGLVREGNEDNYYRGATVFAVADGMGGHLAGEVASKTAVGPIEHLDGVDFTDAEAAEAALVSAIRQANATVVSEATANPDYRGMGTTLTTVLVRDGGLHVAHVGDSRAYLLRLGERITQLTTDHTLVEQLIQEGRLSRDQAATHPQRSVITRAIGVDAEVQVETLPPIVLQPGDQVLLCSDGLSGPVDDDTIADILSATADGQEACEHLLGAAIDAGGPDNITVVLLRVKPGRRGGGSSAPRPGVTTPAGAGRTGGGGAIAAPPEATDPTQDLAGDGLARDDLARDDLARGGAAVPNGDVHQIRTRDEHNDDWATSMGRYGDRQGTAPASASPRRRSRAKRATAGGLAVLVLVGVVAAAGWLVLSRTYFVGVADGRVAVYNGLPQEVASLRLYWLTESSDVAVDDLQPRFQNALAEGITVGSLTEARRTIADYRTDVEQRETPEQPASGTTSPSPSATSGEAVPRATRVPSP